MWNLAKKLSNIEIKHAGPGGVNAVFWLENNKLGSAGADGELPTLILDLNSCVHRVYKGLGHNSSMKADE